MLVNPEYAAPAMFQALSTIGAIIYAAVILVDAGNKTIENIEEKSNVVPIASVCLGIWMVISMAIAVTM